MKECFKCKEIKELKCFYHHKKTKDGHLNKCIDCTKKDVIEREKTLRQNPEWVEKEKERNRKKYHSLGYKDKHKPTYEMKKKSIENYRGKYPEKYKGQIAAQRLIKANKENHLHHWSYNDEHLKDVIELSVKDHNTSHRFMIYDQERKMYRDLDGILLDTKEAHLEYINNFLN